MDLQVLTSRIHSDDLANLPTYEALRGSLADEDFIGSTFRLRDRFGDWRLANVRARILRRDRSGSPRAMLGTITDITEYAAAAAEAANLSVRGAEDNERARIGRELHDSTSQFLVAADLDVLQLLNSPDLAEEVRVKLRGVQASLAAAQAEMRAFAFFLHPPELGKLGLRKALERYCAGFSRRTGLSISMTCANDPDGLAPEIEHALFRVCQEALMNVHRHAFATSASVTLETFGAELRMEIRDDGIGVDGVDSLNSGGVGISSMQARMRSVGGVLELDLTSPGVAVIARAPVSGAGTRTSPEISLSRRATGA